MILQNKMKFYIKKFRLTSEPTSPTVTVEYLNQFKQEVLAEVRQEISKAKQDIINAIRELGR